MYQLVKLMHQKFKIDYQGLPRELDQAEFDFRIKAFNEEIQEYKDAREAGDLEGQLDALIDLMVFVLGACEKHGFNEIEEAFMRVMQANMNKHRVENASESKRGHAFDLKKPAGWRAPYLKDLVQPSSFNGLVVLEGPDGCGKTTLAEFLQDNYGAHVIHSTWSPEIEKDMDNYMVQTLAQAIQISQRQLVVLDRHWISELVYADVYRGGSPRPSLHPAMHNLLAKAGAQVIYCLPQSHEIVETNFNALKENREEMYDDMSEVTKAYESLWDGSFSRYHFKVAGSDYLGHVLANGGFSNAQEFGDLRFVRYDWSADGKDMQAFIRNNVLNKETENA